MNWLISASNRLLRLEDDVAMLHAIAGLAAVLDRGDEIEDSDDPMRLLRELTAGPSEARERIIAAIRPVLLTTEAIAEAFDRYRGVVGGQGVPPEYRLLLCRLQAVGTPGCQAPSQSLRWRLIDREPAKGREILHNLALDIGTQLRQVVEVAIDPELPPALGPPPAGRLFRVAMTGNLEGRVAGNLPIRIGNISAAQAAAGALQLDFYCLRHGNPVIATALAQFLDRAPNPYQLSAVVRELEARRLHGLRLRADGSLHRRGGIQVGTGLDLIRHLAAGAAGADAGVQMSATDSGSFELLVGSAVDTPTAGAPVRVQISRRRNRTDSVASTLRLGIDLGSLTARIRPELERGLTGLDTLLTQIQALLPPSRLADDLITARVTDWFDDAKVRPLLDRLLDQSSGEPLTRVLVQRLGALLDRLDGLWVDDLDTAARDLARQLVSTAGPNLESAGRAELMPLVQPAIETLVDGLRQRLRAQIETSVGNAGKAALDRLATELAQAGHRVRGDATATAERIDALAEPLAGALQGYQNAVAKIGEALAATEQARLDLQLRSETRRTRGQSLDLHLDLDPAHPDAGTLYQQVLAGSLDGALTAARASGGAVLAASGELTRFAGVEKRRGIQVAFIGIQLDAGWLFSGEVTIRSDTSGNLIVHGRGESGASIGLLGERRTISAINVFDLAVAQQTRRLSLGLTVSQRNERLDDDALMRFFDSLAASGIDLLPERIGTEALARLRALRAEDADGLVGGELRVTMELTESELLRVLDIDDPAAGPAGNHVDAERIRATAVDAIIAAIQASGGKGRTLLRNMAQLVRTEQLAGDVRELLHRMARQQVPLPGSIGDGTPDGVLFRRMQRIGERGRALVDLVRAMRQVYFSTEPLQRGAWDIDAYRARQELIDDKLQFWLAADPEDQFDLGRLVGFARRVFGGGDEDAPATFGLLNQQVRPYTLALLRSFHVLTAGGGDSGAPLLADMTLDVDGVPHSLPLA